MTSAGAPPSDAGADGPGRHLAPPAPPSLVCGPRPTFSVVIAAYQAADFVAEAVESVLRQTRPAVEVIVCDDASTDGTVASLEPFAERITLLRRDQNGGEAAAKNTAARNATGDFIVVLDADDTWSEGRLEALGDLAAERPDLDILTSDACLTVGDRVVRRAYDRTWTFDVQDQRRAILERNFIFGHAAVRRQRFLDAGGFDEGIRWTTDWDLWVRMIFDGSRAGLVDQPLAIYRLHEGALSSQRAAMLRGRVETLEKAGRRIDLTPSERDVLARSVAEKRRAAAVEEAREALANDAPGARGLWASIAHTPGHGSRTRVKAAAAAIAPALAKRAILRRSRSAFVGASGLRVEAHPDDDDGTG